MLRNDDCSILYSLSHSPCSLNFIVFSLHIYVDDAMQLYLNLWGKLLKACSKTLFKGNLNIFASICVSKRKTKIVCHFFRRHVMRNVFAILTHDSCYGEGKILFISFITITHQKRNEKETKNGIPFLCHQRSATWYFSFSLLKRFLIWSRMVLSQCEKGKCDFPLLFSLVHFCEIFILE